MSRAMQRLKKSVEWTPRSESTFRPDALTLQKGTRRRSPSIESVAIIDSVPGFRPLRQAGLAFQAPAAFALLLSQDLHLQPYGLMKVSK
jgi:hypothetical protein